MKHYSLEQWDLYAGEKLSDEERLAYEAHLCACDSCLELYMQSLERCAGMYPKIEDEAGLAESVMERISTEGSNASPVSKPFIRVNSNPTKKTPVFTRHPLFHYAVAAAITIILMSSGAFQSLTERIGHLETAETTETAEQEQGGEQKDLKTEHASVSYKIMEKTIVMLDSIQPKHERGGAR
ncbi:MAG: hypothetical protein K0S39_3028 [Paenibacillus sp.]|nr:hypothetical protein [Paenibacillus sp.]